MRVVVIRHGTVDYTIKKRCNSKEYDEDNILYDSAPLKPSFTMTAPEGDFKSIYVSSLQRTYDTCKIAFPGREPVRTCLIDEVPLRAFKDSERRLPFWVWDIAGRFQWLSDTNRQGDSKRKTIERAQKFTDMLINKNEDCAVITHGYFMHVLKVVMKRNGFSIRDSTIKFKNGEHFEAIYEDT
ncbi:Broad specificity phosphatase PhoE [Oscillospiraceae bacterium]|nr:Broad specificity phosphatase PhoE [Oscillospiraceae bacterium]